MKNSRNRIIYITILLSILLHVAGLLLLNREYLLGSEKLQKEAEAEPLELVFEQPPQKAQEQVPEKFYELVENPNATEKKPEATDMLSTQSSESQAPSIQPGQLRAVPGAETEENRKSETAQEESQPQPEVQKAVENALLAYRQNRSFDRQALTRKSQESEEKPESESEEPRGEMQRRPEGFDADLVGDFALSTYAWEWAPYWLAFKRKLNRVWFAPPAYYQLGLIHGHTICRIKVARDGHLVDLKVLRHVGHESLEQSSVNALKSVFPFKPLPKDFPDEYLEISIKMIYPDLRQASQARE